MTKVRSYFEDKIHSKQVDLAQTRAATWPAPGGSQSTAATPTTTQSAGMQATATQSTHCQLAEKTSKRLLGGVDATGRRTSPGGRKQKPTRSSSTVIAALLAHTTAAYMVKRNMPGKAHTALQQSSQTLLVFFPSSKLAAVCLCSNNADSE